MPAPYSLDLRQKAIEAVELGGSFLSVSERFSINRNTLSGWYRRYQETGDYRPKEGYQQGHSHRITDWEAFRAFVGEHGEKTQAEMAQVWPGEEMSEDAIRRGLRKIGFTRKKRLTPIENETSRSVKRS